MSTKSGGASSKKTFSFSFDNSVDDAQMLFLLLMEKMGIKDLKLKEYEDASLIYMVDKTAWLPLWMLKSDEVSVQLTGMRLWDALYVADKGCFLGVAPINRSQYQDNYDKELFTENYDKYPLVTKDSFPFSMIALICQYVLKESLVVEKNTVSCKPLSGLYLLKKPLEHGDILPFQDETLIEAHFLNKTVLNMDPDKKSENIYSPLNQNQFNS